MNRGTGPVLGPRARAGVAERAEDGEWREGGRTGRQLRNRRFASSALAWASGGVGGESSSARAASSGELAGAGLPGLLHCISNQRCQRGKRMIAMTVIPLPTT